MKNGYLEYGYLKGILTYEVGLGCSIGSVVNEMIGLACSYNVNVVADFNGVALSVNPYSSECKVLEDWNNEMNRKAEEYAKSDKAKKDKEEQENTRTLHQNKVNELQETLYKSIGFDKILDWCSELAKHGDYVGVWFDKPRILEKLERAGYIENAYVGTKPEDFNKHSSLMYIVGQVIDCLKEGIPPHPMTISFVEDWKKKYL